MKTVSRTLIKRILPKRSRLSNKTDGGKVLIIGGSKGLYGAGLLAALAATRSGAGYTFLMTELFKFPWLKYPDFIVLPPSMNELKKHSDLVVAIGPGLGVSKAKSRILNQLIKVAQKQVIMDADALTLLAKMKLKELPESWILTPHEGELARLLNVSSKKVKDSRVKSVMAAQKKYGCTIVLKGAETLIADKKSVYAVNTGTKALAKAGTGDVLLGMIAAFLAQKNNSTEAAILGCYVHGMASQLWLDEKKDYLSMRPLDLIERIPNALFILR